MRRFTQAFYLTASLSALLTSPSPAIAGPTATVPGSNPPSTESITQNTISIGSRGIAYHSVTGSFIVHGRHYDDSKDIFQQRGALPSPADDHKTESSSSSESKEPAAASIFYTAYFRDNVSKEKRPIVFFYNGGPGSASIWLHMGSFAPYRVNTPGDQHPEAAPYHLIPNPQTLLDVADLVFIDAPGTGFSRIYGKDASKEFYSIDGDAEAFTQFIMYFLDRYNRFNAPKYLFGESYGTLRSAIIANNLEQEQGIDLNGIILLSQILDYSHDSDTPNFSPGNDLPYVLSLPTYAATAWYHKALPQRPENLEAFLKDVEHFASTRYLLALQQGNDLPLDEQHNIAEQLHLYTGLPVDTLIRAQLRITGGVFEHTLQQQHNTVIGRLDTRYQGPTLDPMEKSPLYDPQSNALSSTYVSLFNEYVRQTLHYGHNVAYKSFVNDINTQWDMHHSLPLPGGDHTAQAPNVIPDLAMAMITNPHLKIMLNSGYYDMATPYYAGRYEMKHLPIPASLNKNITFAQYPVGHMVYVDPETLQMLHDRVAAFIQQPHP